jgi:preprotein translocase subunit SecB
MTEDSTSDNGNPPEFRMQKMYIKDLSFENPNSPEIYLPSKSEPKVDVNLQLHNKKVSEDHWEVSIGITGKIINKGESEQVMFIIEIEHAAVFLLKNIPEEHMEMVLAVDCPTLLFPFTRQIVSQVSVDGGFVPFLMEPINFMGIYQNSKQQREESN